MSYSLRVLGALRWTLGDLEYEYEYIEYGHLHPRGQWAKNDKEKGSNCKTNHAETELPIFNGKDWYKV